MSGLIVAVALDLGTTTIKAGLLNEEGVLSWVVSQPAPPLMVAAGRYESDALAYAEAAESVLAQCMAQTDGQPPLGVCCQRSSFLIWERDSGKLITPLISWQDGRGAESCDALRAEAGRICELAGLPLTPYYLGPKLRVLMRNHPEWRAQLESGRYLLGTLDTFLVWRWTAGRQYVVDASMAARTLLMDVRRLNWSGELCALFDVSPSLLPQIVPSAGVGIMLSSGQLLQVLLGDQSAALWCSMVPDQRAAMVNLGTGGFVAAYVVPGKHIPPGYLQMLVCVDAKGRAWNAGEGTLNSIASALAHYPADRCLPGELAMDDIYCLAEPSGLGAPYFRNDLGINFSASVDHLPPQRIAMLLQEAIIFRVVRIFEDFQRALGVESVLLSGGLSNLPCIQQGIASLLPNVYLARQPEAGLLGAARLAAGMGWENGLDVEKVVINQGMTRLKSKYAGWKIWLDGLLQSGATSSWTEGVR